MSPYRRVDRDLRREGLRSFRLGLFLIRRDSAAAEKHLRGSLRDLVEAFLEDRRGNADLFTLAHRIGYLLVHTFKCPYEFREEDQRWTQTCPIPGLHRRVAFSVALLWARSCSICGADEFDCDHVPGETYEGGVCELERTKAIGLDHLALTHEPDFVYTFIQADQVSQREVVAEFGRPLREGERLMCDHCRFCRGYFGPSAEDLDPSSWRDMDEASETAEAA